MLMVAGNVEEVLEICGSSLCVSMQACPQMCMEARGGNECSLHYHFWPYSLAAVSH